MRWRPKSPASRLFAQSFIQTQIKENIKAHRHGSLSGETTGDLWFPSQRTTSNTENVSIWWRHHEWRLFVNWTIENKLHEIFINTPCFSLKKSHATCFILSVTGFCHYRVINGYSNLVYTFIMQIYLWYISFVVNSFHLKAPVTAKKTIGLVALVSISGTIKLIGTRSFWEVIAILLEIWYRYIAFIKGNLIFEWLN